jgi:hypothetical protein
MFVDPGIHPAVDGAGDHYLQRAVNVQIMHGQAAQLIGCRAALPQQGAVAVQHAQITAAMGGHYFQVAIAVQVGDNDAGPDARAAGGRGSLPDFRAGLTVESEEGVAPTQHDHLAVAIQVGYCRGAVPAGLAPGAVTAAIAPFEHRRGNSVRRRLGLGYYYLAGIVCGQRSNGQPAQERQD